jgi:hypothetical protein
MKKSLVTLLTVMITGWLSFGQTTDPLVGKCIASSGADSKYLKDFRVQLGKAASQGDLRYKANISLWKDMKYRFTMCSADDSKGSLILNMKDESNKVVLSSFDQKSGKTYTSVDFICNKSGIYQLSYDFTNEEQGSGVGVISVLK